MKKKIAILGSTGSIGKTLIEIIKKEKKNFEIVLLNGSQIPLSWKIVFWGISKLRSKESILGIVKKIFLLTLFKTFLVFMSLAFVLNIFEEVNFFKDYNVSITLPIFLTLLNIPSVIFDIFPFIFLISAQFTFIKLMEQNEIIVFKNFGLTNFKIIQLFSILSFILGLFIITIYYNFASNLKYSYLSLKNTYAKDNKYLAVITENGIWIKDEINTQINIINANKIENKNENKIDKT